MKKFFLPFLFVIALSVVAVPISTFADDSVGLVPCGTEKGDNGQVLNPCKFEHFLTLVSRVVKFVLFKMLVPVAAILIAIAGFKMLFSGGNTESYEKGKKMLGTVVLGMFIAIGAWVIVHTILTILGYDGSWVGL